MAVAVADAGFPEPRWKYLNQILTTQSPFFEEPPTPELLKSSKVLVIGAGGLGCEILKNLALSGFRDIHVIDMDTIDVSNLNRQFLFRQTDVGKPKATVAAKFVEKRVKGVKIKPYYGKIQDKDDEYYLQFSMVICGLDSVEARKWINQKLIGLVKDYSDNPQALKPLVDGGTEGFKGQARVIFPTMTSCIECQLDLHAPRAQVPLCTIATVPRQPQHCIEWAHQIAWSAERKDDTLDTDDPEHISWLYTHALARANEFQIPGVTYSMTQGVVKNIIPAIASTNAIVAAACCNEAFKILTSTGPALGYPGTSNYMMYTGDDSVYTHTFEHQRKEDCPECGPAQAMHVDGDWTLQDLLRKLSTGETGEEAREFKQPTLSSGDGPLYYSQPASLEEHTRPNLKRKLTELLQDGEEVAVSDPAYQTQFRFKLSFRDG
ncbi:MAG: hypothetical protein M1828_001360 [Chrysothrix sp. TS-e1954]|nr:MAG: hypothetical protein M1828_001360 [Chrysothrix sp. TS-e1954]